MNKIFSYVALILLFISCKNESQKNRGIINSNQTKQNKEVVENNHSLRIIERFFPTENTITKIDTILENHNLELSIIQSSLNTYVVNEYTDRDSRTIDRYRDYSNRVVVKEDGKVLIDTTFLKESIMLHPDDKEFLNVSTFHGYWFKEIKGDTILNFFGVINQPETDWAFDFDHYLNLNTKEFITEESGDGL